MTTAAGSDDEKGVRLLPQLDERRLETNLRRVRARIDDALDRAGRPSGSAHLVAVTKSVDAATTANLHRLGQQRLGESRIQSALPKIETLGPGPEWHLIGSLQSNKVRKAVAAFSWLHSIDSLALLERVDRVTEETSLPPRSCFIQVNVTGEGEKHGIPPESLASLLEAAKGLSSVKVVGLMTMARYDPQSEAARPAFRALRQLRDDANRAGWYRDSLPHLSMGMTNDFEVAVEEGATFVRVGSALFLDGDSGDE